MDFLSKHATLELELNNKLRHITATKNTTQRYKRVVVSKTPMEHMKRVCRVLMPSEGETWKECCEECVSQEENWDRELIKIKMESKTGDMEDAPKEVYAYYNILIDASLGLEE